jgi:hypothetical protein
MRHQRNDCVFLLPTKFGAVTLHLSTPVMI